MHYINLRFQHLTNV